MVETHDVKDLPNNFTLRLTCDWQLGSITARKELIPQILEPVRTKKNYRIAFLGDMFDNINPRDKRFSFQDLDQELLEYSRAPTGKERGPIAIIDGARDYFEDRIAAIADKVVVCGIGNHEAVSSDVTDPIKTICDHLGIRYGGYSCLLRINETSQALLWHGRRSIGSGVADPFQRNLAIKRQLVATNAARWKDPNINLIAQGHVNHLVVVRPEESAQLLMSYDWDKEQLGADFKPADPRWYVCCGSIQKAFVKGRLTYGEAKGYTPLPLGCVDVEFRDSKIHDARPVYMW